MNTIRRFLSSHWKVLLLYMLAMVTLASLLLYKLGSLVPELSSSELLQRYFDTSWHNLLHAPLNIFLSGPQWLLLTLDPHHDATTSRLASALLGVITIATFSYVIRRWYGLRAAVFGSVLFACSAWFLHISRYGGSDISYLLVIPLLLAVQIYWERHATRFVVSLVAVVLLGLLLYTPGTIWLIPLSFSLQPALIRQLWQSAEATWRKLAVAGIGLLTIAPLVIALIKTPRLLRYWIGLPQHFATPTTIGKHLLQTVSYLGYHGPNNPYHWLDRLPVLDMFSLAMLVLGVIFYCSHIQAPRTRLLVGLFIVSAVLFALGGPVAYSLVVPIAYLGVTAGIGYLLHEWLSVFPRNPLARGLGYGLLGLVVLLACVYNLRSYFIAWPHNSIVRQAYSRPEADPHSLFSAPGIPTE